jgi:hypothetical protein
VKITFEGHYNDILDQMAGLLEMSGIKISTETYAHAKTATASPPVPKGIVSEAIVPVDKPVDKPVEKPVGKPGRTAKQLENDERLRARAKAKKEAGLKPFEKAPKPSMPPEVRETPPPQTAEDMDPAEIVKLRQKTLEDLQSAYANGHHQEVLELLSRFGNGAKSFRELPADAFVPIREAIDNGALT